MSQNNNVLAVLHVVISKKYKSLFVVLLNAIPVGVVEQWTHDQTTLNNDRDLFNRPSCTSM